MGSRFTTPAVGRRPFALLGALALALACALLAAPAPARAVVPPPGDVLTATSARTLDHPPRPGDDFPRMPGRCYESDHLTLKDAPCRIVTYPRSRPTLLVWGDSHGWMYLPALRKLAKRTQVSLILVIAGGCPPALPLVSAGGSCERHNERTLAFVTRLQQRPSRLKVLIGGFWSGYRQAYRWVQRERAGGPDSGLTPYQEHRAELAEKGAPRLFRGLGALKVDVDVIGQAATVPVDPPACSTGREPYQCDLPRAQALDAEGDNRRWLRAQMSHLVGRPRLIDATPAYCTARTCRAHVGEDNTYYDDIHLGATLTATLTSYFAPSFADLG